MWFAMDIEDLVPEDHPLREIKGLVDGELRRLQPRFRAAYSRVGRPSIPPERLIKATLLQVLYSIRSERQLCEQLRYNMLFRWFLDLRPDDDVFCPTSFTKNRARFAEHGLMEAFFNGSVAEGIREGAMSTEHFSVDGTLIQAWASMKSFRPKDEDQSAPDGNGWAEFEGKKRSNQTHQSKTDPEALLRRKGPGQEARLSHSLHTLVEHRSGLVVDVVVDEATQRSERAAAKRMLRKVRRRHAIRPKTLAADKGYDDGEFLCELEKVLGVTPHVAIRAGPIKSCTEAGDARRRARRRERSKAYRVSQRKRRLVEKPFGWLKVVGGLARTRFVGRWKTQLYAYAAAAAFNLLGITRWRALPA